MPALASSEYFLMRLLSTVCTESSAWAGAAASGSAARIDRAVAVLIRCRRDIVNMWIFLPYFGFNRGYVPQVSGSCSSFDQHVNVAVRQPGLVGLQPFRDGRRKRCAGRDV